MHPAPSVIVFTVLSGLGFGFLAMLGLGIAHPTGWGALPAWGLGYALATGGLLASTFHLGRPERALLAFSQWRTSWLSREGWASVASLLVLAPVALAAIGGGGLRMLGVIGGLLCLVTVFVTAMIYTQLKTVPRWNHWSTPAVFVAFALTGGAILVPLKIPAIILLVALGVLLVWTFRNGDGRFAALGQSTGTATGLDTIGDVRSFAPPHTGPNYLTKEMIHIVGRKHAARLRVIALAFASILPALLLLALPQGLWAAGLAAILHVVGAFAARWLFFAEAEHVVGLYYGAHDRVARPAGATG
jgi:sulfite dehydrogenase (quinone) subunit SoeC